MPWLFDQTRSPHILPPQINLISSLPRLALASGVRGEGWWGGAGRVVFRFLCYNKIKKMWQKKIIYRFLIILFYFICGVAGWTAFDFLLASLFLF